MSFIVDELNRLQLVVCKLVSCNSMEFYAETIPKLKIFESAPGYIITGQIKCHL
jgi:hypothetical protein